VGGWEVLLTRFRSLMDRVDFSLVIRGWFASRSRPSLIPNLTSSMVSAEVLSP